MGDPLLSKPPPQPLLRKSKNGVLYERTDKVEDQIREALSLDPVPLVTRAQNRDYEDKEHFKEECLVHLIRHYWKRKDKNTTTDLLKALIDRCIPFVDYNLRALQPRFKEEAYQDVIGKMTEKILSGDQGDFFEVRFQCALERLSISEFGRYFRIQRMEEKTEPDDPPEDICEEPAQEEEQYDPFVSPELNAKFWEGIGKLDANRREAFILRYKDDWPIESEDPKTPTISKYFKRTPRTIRYWLAEAKEFLRRYCERGE